MNMKRGLELKLKLADDCIISLEPSCYCVFIDETGTETLSNPNYPIFGFGGCGILAAHYEEWLMQPWKRMKLGCFGDADIPIHAVDIRPTISNFDKKVEGLNAFFENGPYARIASIHSTTTKIENGLPSFHELAIEVCRSQIYQASAPWKPTKIAVIFESCERTNLTVARRFMNIHTATAKYADGRSYEIPIETLFANKEAKLDGLEVADFIINTAGTTCRDVIKKKIRPLDRPDFAVTFGKHHAAHLVHFKLITGMNSTESV